MTPAGGPKAGRHLSATSIRAFEDCPAKFKATRIDGRKEPPSAALVVGIAIHEAIETVVNVWKAVADSPDALVASFRAHLSDIGKQAYLRAIAARASGVSSWGPGGRRGATENGLACATALIQRASSEPITTAEMPFSVPLRSGWTLDGFIDAVTIDGRVIDFKSQTADRGSPWRWSPEKAAKERQPGIYGAAYLHRFGAYPTGFLFLVAEKRTPSIVEEFPVAVTPARVAVARLVALTVSYAVEAAYFPKNPAGCRWCPFRSEGGCKP